MFMSEILSPVGSIEAFYSAINGGCNAVYLGVKKFNARAYANNFSIEELKLLVEYAHLRNVKVYVTMNTIIYDQELDEAYQIVDQLANIHVDAIIVQDLAILKYIVDNYKTIEAHASTQMGIDDLMGASVIKQLGATRIVFARETPIEVLKDIKNNLNIEIETFVHGALCVSYSGNCLMSSFIGKRSGNRGRCAGCCRQVYTLKDTTNNKFITSGYLLSMKDLNVSTNLKELDFVDSLKIEGRMKEPYYVYEVTKFYSDLLHNKKVDYEDINKVFNRTYTKGFLFNETSKNITNIDRPNNYGYEIGYVVKQNKNTIWIKLFKPLKKGDQIRIESKSLYEEISLPINKMFDANFKECDLNDKLAIISCNKDIKIGSKVYKTKDIDFVSKIEKELKSDKDIKLDIEFNFNAKINEYFSLEVIYQDIHIKKTSNVLVEKSINNSVTKENIVRQLSKLNDTPYRLKNIRIDIDDNCFISLKSINELRRDVIASLNEFRLKKDVIKTTPKKIDVRKRNIIKPEICVQVSNIDQYNFVKKLGIKHIYFDNIINRNNPTYIEAKNEMLIGGFGSIKRYENCGSILVSDYSFNVSNYQSVAILSSLGVDRITLSLEINKEQINAIVSNYFKCYNTYPNLELIVYGKTRLMHTKYCLLKRLNLCGQCKKSKFIIKDKFEEFPLSFNNDCTMNVHNSKTLNIISDIKKLNGINYFRLVFTNETNEEIKQIITNFTKIINFDEQIDTFNGKTQTRGHFNKSAI